MTATEQEGGEMNELRRKYDGLKQAHKELSVEVVHLRSRLALAEAIVKAIHDGMGYKASKLAEEYLTAYGEVQG